eukprot:CAMPEP_0177637278 /NCGR_PEP_ID=MMETSP0447-20121125/4888_1 /TAXON_ID=0 /ORGANISM="Stygamoeba regulata, Strain BSH-02190019" /LENGTH=1321 /DNA_ID=CAMNT_0019139199 /DNA_START=185 /DNA_END=4150 /DNA_ORIENTATION=-
MGNKNSRDQHAQKEDSGGVASSTSDFNRGSSGSGKLSSGALRPGVGSSSSGGMACAKPTITAGGKLYVASFVTKRELKQLKRCVLKQYPYIFDLEDSALISDLRRPDQPIVVANHHFCELSGYAAEEFLGYNCRFLQGRYTSRETVRRIREAIAAGQPLNACEILNFRRDGTPFINRFELLPVNVNLSSSSSSAKSKSTADQHTRPTHYLAVQRDITTLQEGKPPAEWCAPELAMFLERVGLDTYVSPFIEAGITGVRFMQLDDELLDSLDIRVSLVRRALLRVAAHCRENAQDAATVWGLSAEQLLRLSDAGSSSAAEHDHSSAGGAAAGGRVSRSNSQWSNGGSSSQSDASDAGAMGGSAPARRAPALIESIANASVVDGPLDRARATTATTTATATIDTTSASDDGADTSDANSDTASQDSLSLYSLRSALQKTLSTPGAVRLPRADHWLLPALIAAVVELEREEADLEAAFDALPPLARHLARIRVLVPATYPELRATLFDRVMRHPAVGIDEQDAILPSLLARLRHGRPRLSTQQATTASSSSSRSRSSSSSSSSNGSNSSSSGGSRAPTSGGEGRLAPRTSDESTATSSCAASEVDDDDDDAGGEEPADERPYEASLSSAPFASSTGGGCTALVVPMLAVPFAGRAGELPVLAAVMGALSEPDAAQIRELIWQQAASTLGELRVGDTVHVQATASLRLVFTCVMRHHIGARHDDCFEVLRCVLASLLCQRTPVHLLSGVHWATRSGHHDGTPLSGQLGDALAVRSVVVPTPLHTDTSAALRSADGAALYAKQVSLAVRVTAARAVRLRQLPSGGKPSVPAHLKLRRLDSLLCSGSAGGTVVSHKHASHAQHGDEYDELGGVAHCEHFLRLLTRGQVPWRGLLDDHEVQWLVEAIAGELPDYRNDRRLAHLGGLCLAALLRSEHIRVSALMRMRLCERLTANQAAMVHVLRLACNGTLHLAPEIAPTELELVDSGAFLGRGASASVMRGAWRSRGARARRQPPQPVAVKVFTIERMEPIPLGVRREVTIMALAQHPNVVRLLGVHGFQSQRDATRELAGKQGDWNGASACDKNEDEDEDDNDAAQFPNDDGSKPTRSTASLAQFSNVLYERPFCVLELMGGGSLFDLLHSAPEKLTQVFRPQRALRWLVDVCEVLDYMHDRELLHRDLKSPNVLLQTDYERAKLTDYGLSRAANMVDAPGIMTAAVGTLSWSAPELVREESDYGKPIDVYAFGMVVYEVITGLVPYQHLKGHLQILKAIEQGAVLPVDTDLAKSYPHAVHKPLVKLFRECTKRKALRRPPIKSVLKSLREIQTLLK